MVSLPSNLVHLLRARPDGRSLSFLLSMNKITLTPFSFRAYVPEDVWYPPPPTMTKFSPGHDARLLTIEGASNETSFDIYFEYDQPMDWCVPILRFILLLGRLTSLSYRPQ